jgi:hypothetical protein
VIHRPLSLALSPAAGARGQNQKTMSRIATFSPIDAWSTGDRGDSTDELRATFQDAVGSLFYGQMIKALRSGVGKPAYFHGGQAEEMFQAQMDQQVAADLARDHADGFVEELFQRFLVDHGRGNDAGVARPGVFDGRGNESQTTPFAKPQGRATLDPAASPSLDTLRQAAKSTELAESAEQASWARPAGLGAGMTTGTPVIPVMNRK